MPDWSDVQAMLKTRQAQAGESRDAALADHLRTARAIGIQMAEYSASDPWKTLATHLQALVAQAETERNGIVIGLSQGDVAGDQAARLLRQLARVEGRLEAWRQALALPGELAARGKSLTPPPEAA